MLWSLVYIDRSTLWIEEQSHTKQFGQTQATFLAKKCNRGKWNILAKIVQPETSTFSPKLRSSSGQCKAEIVGGFCLAKMMIVLFRLQCKYPWSGPGLKHFFKIYHWCAWRWLNMYWICEKSHSTYSRVPTSHIWSRNNQSSSMDFSLDLW